MALVDLPALLTLEQVAELMRVTVLDAHRAAATGELPMVRSRGCWFVDTRELLRELGVSLRHDGTPRLVAVPGGGGATASSATDAAGTCWKGAS